MNTEATTVPIESQFYRSILSLPFHRKAPSQWGKFGTIVGTMGIAASSVFDYDPNLFISLTVLSGFTWICGAKIARDFESQAQTMLENAKRSEKYKDLYDSPDLLKPLLQKSSESSEFSLFTNTWEVMQGRLWPLIDRTISEGPCLNSFQVAKLGQIVISTDSPQDKVILQHPRYGKIVRGGHGWDTFARICFGWENLIMAEGEKHQKILKALHASFTKQAVREQYFECLKMVSKTTASNWKANNAGVLLLNASMEHSCKSVTTCFLGEEAANSEEIIQAVQILMYEFWDLAQYKPKAMIHQLNRSNFWEVVRWLAEILA